MPIVKYTNNTNIPLALAVWLAKDHYQYNLDPMTISATTLMKPLRQIILPSRVPAGEGIADLASLIDSRVGTAVHTAMEEAWLTSYKESMADLGYPTSAINRVRVNPTAQELAAYDTAYGDCIPVYLEQRLSKQVGNWTVTGAFDFVSEGMVQDLKNTSTYTYKNQNNATKYAQQGSIYRWLGPDIITSDQMQIIYRFTDWKPAMFKSDPTYPASKILTQTFQLASIQETQAFIEKKLASIDQYINAAEEDLPLCTDSELWRSEPVYKFYAKGDINAARSTKNFPSMQEATIHMHSEGKGAIKEVPGQVTACKYCAAFPVCSQKDSLIANGDLSL